MVLAVVFGGLGIWLITHRDGQLRYRKKAMLTGSELEFFHCLRRALPECVVAPQIAATALMEPVGIGRTRQAALALIAPRRVGYAVFDEQMQLLTVVELDHRSRRKRADAAMDQYFADAGIGTLRFSAKQMPSDSHIRSCVFASPQPSMHRQSQPFAGTMPDIEFERPQSSWRNTVNAHV